jgi:hypothetical protein
LLRQVRRWRALRLVVNRWRRRHGGGGWRFEPTLAPARSKAQRGNDSANGRNPAPASAAKFDQTHPS